MQRTIKSYVLRAGRVSSRQQQGLSDWLHDYSLALSEESWNFASIFGREADTVVEIGFGMGGSLLAMAQAQPAINFIGIEVHQAGIGSLAADLHDHAISNVRIAPYDAVEIFKKSIPDNSLAGVQLFFPDPWPKKRHHKRRLIQANFVRLLVDKIRISGFLHCATDWEDYALHIHEVLSANPMLSNIQPDGLFVPRPDTRPVTKFERRGERLGHQVWDLMFKKELA